MVPGIKGILDCLSGEYNETDDEKLEDMICQIKNYQKLIDQLEELRKIKPNRMEAEHRSKISELWSCVTDSKVIVGEEKENDILEGSNNRPEWTHIGFQGLDPITDFRGGGFLSLLQLCFFASQNSEIIANINERANHPTTGYGLAITGINITVLLMDALKAGQLKPYFYTRESINIEEFHQIYSKCFLLFDRLWVQEKPEDIMKFSEVFSLFKMQLIDSMQSGDI